MEISVFIRCIIQKILQYKKAPRKIEGLFIATKMLVVNKTCRK
jgi:hypothetical protein